jgi:hypothetical protein
MKFRFLNHWISPLENPIGGMRLVISDNPLQDRKIPSFHGSTSRMPHPAIHYRPTRFWLQRITLCRF